MSRTTLAVVWMALFGIATTLETTLAFHSNVAMVGQPARRAERQSRSRTTSRLQYSDNSDASSQPRWWRSLLSPPSGAAAASSTATASPAAAAVGEASQQETVDAYLEFLDRRYRRLHSDEEEARKRKQDEITPSASSSNSKPIPFSAMDWLMNGSSSSATMEEEQRKQEDALYVLGVAGLASQKLLQKHHLQTTSSSTPPAVGGGTTQKKSSSTPENVIEVHAEATVEEEGTSINAASQLIIKKVLVPLIRAVYIVQRRKELIVQRIQSKVGGVVSIAAQRVVHPVARRIRQGPKAVLVSLLEIGGGKRNIAFTLACAYATVVLLQPILQAAVSEASVRP
jgi:hypothetical protein